MLSKSDYCPLIRQSLEDVSHEDYIVQVLKICNKECYV